MHKCTPQQPSTSVATLWYRTLLTFWTIAFTPILQTISKCNQIIKIIMKGSHTLTSPTSHVPSPALVHLSRHRHLCDRFAAP